MDFPAGDIVSSSKESSCYLFGAFTFLLRMHLRVVMLTTSDHIRDANQAYQLGANSFLVKPLDFQNAAELTRSLDVLLAKAQH